MYLFFALFLAFILMIWFETDAFAEYAEVLGLDEFHPVLKNFLNQRRSGSPASFLMFIQQFHDCFFVRLIACPKCLSTWLGGIMGFLIVVPAMSDYGFFGGLACASALPYLTYLAYNILKYASANHRS